MKFSDLSERLQEDIACSIFDSFGTVSDLTTTQLEYLNLLSPNELFEKWLQWHGIIEYTEVIHKAHTEIYKEGT